MKIFIDSANMADIKAATALGVIDGCTTNPTHIAKAIKETGKSYEDIIREICDVVDGPISAEAISTNAEELVPEARKLAKIHERVVVKVPMNDEGLKSVHILSKEGIKTNVTLIFSANQALMAAKAGATFVSPFVMRLDKIGQIGMQLIEEIVHIFNNYDAITTEIIAASIINPRWVTDCALAGSHIATIPYVTFAELSKHPMTDLGIAQFLKDWNAENA